VAYYAIAHASKLVRPGSIRIASNNLDSLPNVAFQTPDKKVVVIVVNAAQTAQTFHIRYRGKLITPVLAPGAVGTYIW
jgi:glucosylceramidase